ncbi:MAG: serine/threonine protein kinase [Myxococcales bacterium]|nr:serine/threonine protein kinase [Myxococcales bacterium]
MSAGSRLSRLAAVACALIGLIWSVRILLATDSREIELFLGVVAGLCAAAALGIASATGSPRLGAALAAPTAVLLGIKPYVLPLSYAYDGVRRTFSPSSETHLYFLVPGFLLAVVSTGMAFVPTAGDQPSRQDLRLALRVVGGVTGLLAAAGLLLSFTNSRGSIEMVLLGLVPSAVVGALSLVALLRGEPPSGSPASRGASPYRGAASAVGSLSAPMGDTTDALLRALAHAPAPGLHAMPDALISLPAGTRVGGFVVKDMLGAGGMGVVYRARDERLGRDVALKLLPPHLAADPMRRARFFREARMAASVLCPNVAAVYELGESEPPFIAMELVVGETLRARIVRGFVGTSEVHRIARAVAAGLAAAHARGVVHRDLKPENVMIAADGTPKIVDFGLARDAASQPAELGTTAHPTLTRSGLIMGTPRYMAPEQAAGGEVDARVDVYAFGLLVVDLLSGVGLDPAIPAFRRADAARDLALGVVPELAPVVERCLAFDPQGRYEDARALLAALSASPAVQGVA